MNKLLSLALLSLTVTLGAGCASDVEEFNCGQICQQYQDCWDASYDVATCTDTCQDNANNDTSFASEAQACETCQDGVACTASWSCDTECSSVIPN